MKLECKAIFKKLLAYELYIQTGLIAQGLLQYLCATFSKTVWECFGSWMRTIRDDTRVSSFFLKFMQHIEIIDFFKTQHFT